MELFCWNYLPHIAPLPSKPALDNFLRLITKIVDESNNTISLTPKKPPIEPIGQKQLSKQFFQTLMKQLKKNQKLLKKEPEI